jgi:hypothetical protein
MRLFAELHGAPSVRRLPGGGAVTEPTPTQVGLARDLTDLGLGNLGGRVLEGLVSVKSALSYVERNLGVKQRAASHIADAEGRARNFKWCEKAKFVIDHWEAQS